MTAELQRLTENNRQEFLGIIDDLLDRYGLTQGNLIKLKVEDGYDVETYSKYVPFLKEYGAIEERSSVMDFIELEASVYVNESQLKDLKNNLINGVAQKMYTTASITFNGKVIHLNHGGSTVRIHEFKIHSKKAYMYSIFHKLYTFPDEETPIKEIVPNCGTPAKDVPKTIGFVGELKNIFFEVDSKKNTLTFHKQRKLTAKESEILTRFVNKK